MKKQRKVQKEKKQTVREYLNTLDVYDFVALIRKKITFFEEKYYGADFDIFDIQDFIDIDIVEWLESEYKERKLK